MKDSRDSNTLGLGICRILFYLLVYRYMVAWDYLLHWKNVPSELWLGQGLARPLVFLRDSLNWSFVFWIWKVSLLTSAIGLLSRLSVILAFASGFLLIGHAQSFGYYTHSFMPILWGLFVMCFSKVGDSFSVDQVLKKYFFLGKDFPTLNGWTITAKETIFFFRLILCTVFFTAAISKIQIGGLDWFARENLFNFMARAWVWHRDIKPAGSEVVSSYLFQHASWLPLFGAGAFLLELMAPLALLSRKSFKIIILGLFVMQQLIKYTLLVSFSLYFSLYIFWIPWGNLVQWCMSVGLNSLRSMKFVNFCKKKFFP
jgi:hypothetical protein